MKLLLAICIFAATISVAFAHGSKSKRVCHTHGASAVHCH